MQPVTEKQMRKAAYKFMDRIIRAMVVIQKYDPALARGQTYRWLSQELGIPRHLCRIKDLPDAMLGKTVSVLDTRLQQIIGKDAS